MKPALIAILTDFGLSDPYVGIMKGVIQAIFPQSNLIDLTQLVSPGDIQQGAFYLWQASQDLPAGTVFLAVVDPGVGTPRKGIYLRSNQQIFIGPDNGLFSYLTYQEPASAWELSNLEYQLPETSHTFHGRDIFAPAAAYAAKGIPGEQFGKPVKTLVQLEVPACSVKESAATGEVINIDHFGNIVTSLGTLAARDNGWDFNSWIDQQSITIPGLNISVKIRGQKLPLVTTFADIPPDTCAGIIGSTGLLEIAANQTSAAEILGIDRGEPVTLSWD